MRLMSSRPRPVPGIARGPHAFSPAARAPIANPMQLPPVPSPPPVSDEISPDELAMEIYCRVAAQFIASGRAADRAVLTGLAIHAQAAAEAYFQTMTGEFHGQEETSSQAQG